MRAPGESAGLGVSRVVVVSNVDTYSWSTSDTPSTWRGTKKYE